MNFTTKGPVSTDNIYNINPTDATASYTVSGTFTSKGVWYGTVDNKGVNGNWATVTDAVTGSFTATLSSLASGSVYYAYAYTYDGFTYTWGNVISFLAGSTAAVNSTLVH